MSEAAVEHRVLIEPAKTGRSKCRVCSEPIEKGTLRFGREAPNPWSDSGGMQMRWYHPSCGTEIRADEVLKALEAFDGERPAGYEELIERAREAEAQMPRFPFAERASSGRARCRKCRTNIKKGELRIGTPREIERHGETMIAPGWRHVACSEAEAPVEEWLESIRENSRELSADDFEIVTAQVQRPGNAS